jgi:hypothetical protein
MFSIERSLDSSLTIALLATLHHTGRLSGPLKMAITLRRRSLIRLILFAGCLVILRLFIVSSSSTRSTVTSLYGSDPTEIQKQGVFDLVSRGGKALDARKHKFLQVRMGRDERPDLFTNTIDDGVADYWDRFQKPLCVNHSDV